MPDQDAASSAGDYIRERLAEIREAKDEEEGHGEELAVIERGDGNTLGGGGGRGIF